jgi:glycosyltransferase 2 family protein
MAMKFIVQGKFLQLLSERYTHIILGVFITALALYLGLRRITIGDITAAFSETKYMLVFLALLSVAVNTFGKTVRWQVLMGTRGKSIKRGKILAALLVGQMLNTLSFARIGDLSRVYIAGRMGIGKVFAFSTLIVEKFLDTLAYVFLFIVLFLLMQLPDWITHSGYTFLIISILLATGLLISSFRSEWILKFIRLLLSRFPAKFRLYTLPRIQAAIDGLRLFKNFRETSLSSLWSVIIWITAILTNHLALIAMDIYLPITASILLLLGLQAGISLPSTPGRIGVFQYICVLVLGIFGVSQASAFGYGILLHVIVLFPTTLAGLIIFWLIKEPISLEKRLIETDPGLEN